MHVHPGRPRRCHSALGLRNSSSGKPPRPGPTAPGQPSGNADADRLVTFDIGALCEPAGSPGIVHRRQNNRGCRPVSATSDATAGALSSPDAAGLVALDGAATPRGRPRWTSRDQPGCCRDDLPPRPDADTPPGRCRMEVIQVRGSPHWRSGSQTCPLGEETYGFGVVQEPRPGPGNRWARVGPPASLGGIRQDEKW